MNATGILAGLVGVATMALNLQPARGQAPSAFSTIDVRSPAAPRPLIAGGAAHLVYELYITNLSPRETVLDAVDVTDRTAAAGAAPLLHLEGAALDGSLGRVGAPRDDREPPHVLPGGQTAVLFLWVTLTGGAPPAALSHRFATHLSGGAPSSPGGASDGPAMSVSGVDVPVSPGAPRIIAPPLEGDHWVAANGPDNAVDHRRTILALSGVAHIAQRFAIDWVRLYDEGRTFRGDPLKNESYRAFGADALAVADGTVVETLDGLPENVPDAVARAVPITPQTLGGNYVLLDVGDGTCAFYGHLQPGSLKVKNGDRVRRGQILGRVGNTGNSTEPHLHFHLSDRRSAMDAEGIPYAFASFTLEANPADIGSFFVPVGASLGLNPSGLAKWKATPPQRREAELPLNNAVVTFPGR